MSTGETSGGTSRYTDEAICAEDIWTLNLLSLARGIDEQLMDGLVAWWQTEGNGQNLLAFMAIRNAIPIDHAQILGEAAEGTGSTENLPPVFTQARIVSIRQLVQQFQQRANNQSQMAAAPVGNRRPPAPRRRKVKRQHFQVGDTLGKCILTHSLGKGATCSVYAALHRSLNITVAVKIFDTSKGLAGPLDYDAFGEEARVVARMNHPGMVRILDFEEGEPPYLILEYVDGMSVNELIGRSGTIDENQAVHIGKRTAEALQYAHDNGVVHRDVKPANILIDRSGGVKVTDLGLAGLTGIIRQMETDGKQVLCGTPAYIAPEVAVDASAGDHRSDIYSLGATMYHMLTGQYPFKAPSVEMMILKHLRSPLTPPHELRPGLNENLSNIVCGMMTKTPEQRYQSMNQVIEALTNALQKPKPSGMQSTITTRIKTKLVRMLLRESNEQE